MAKIYYSVGFCGYVWELKDRRLILIPFLTDKFLCEISYTVNPLFELILNVSAIDAEKRHIEGEQKEQGKNSSFGENHDNR